MKREQPAPWGGCWLEFVVERAKDGGLEGYRVPVEWRTGSSQRRRVAWGRVLD
jgi:hypothetical protein